MLFDEYLRNCSKSEVKMNRWCGWREKCEKWRREKDGSRFRKWERV